MLIDHHALAIVDRKCARLACDRPLENDKLLPWLHELGPFLRWVLSVPVLNAYVRQILEARDGDESKLHHDLVVTRQQLTALAARLRALPGKLQSARHALTPGTLSMASRGRHRQRSTNERTRQSFPQRGHRSCGRERRSYSVQFRVSARRDTHAVVYLVRACTPNFSTVYTGEGSSLAARCARPRRSTRPPRAGDEDSADAFGRRDDARRGRLPRRY